MIGDTAFIRGSFERSVFLLKGNVTFAGVSFGLDLIIKCENDPVGVKNVCSLCFVDLLEKHLRY